MALKIQPTPILQGEEAKNFEERILKDLKRPSRLVDTPKIEKARMLVKEYAAKLGKK
jgi:hypothetical protein